MNNLLGIIIPVLVGTVITINGFAIKVDDILNNAKEAANRANLHQIATVVELYYSDHDKYPEASGGRELIDLLQDEGYISNKPLDPTVFSYTAEDNGQNYKLAIKS